MGTCSSITPIIPLEKNEGIYIRDKKTGKVRAEIGMSYQVKRNEELYPKNLTQDVEEALFGRAPSPRDKTRVVTFRVPRNSAVEIFDSKGETTRIVFGHDKGELVKLMPFEEPTLPSKQVSGLNQCFISLGPETHTLLIPGYVETKDHAKYKLELSFQWQFDITSNDEDGKIFAVPDFIGNISEAISGRVRSTVARVSFSEFYKSSTDIILFSIFGMCDDGKNPAGDSITLPENSLKVSKVNIVCMEPADENTKQREKEEVERVLKKTQIAVKEHHEPSYADKGFEDASSSDNGGGLWSTLGKPIASTALSFVPHIGGVLSSALDKLT